MSNTQDSWVQIWLDSIEEMRPSEYGIPSDFYGSEELRKMGIKCGERCLLHKTTTVVCPERLELGHDTRIDGFSVISATGGITIGNHVHMASHLVVMGGAGIEIGNFCSIASGSKIFSASDDVGGRGLVGPCVPMHTRHVHSGKVIMEPHSVLAINSVMMPSSKLPYGATLLPFSILMKADLHQGCILQGVPAKVIKGKPESFLERARKADKEGV